ncbi:MAG: hypothetical protein AB1497_10875 [Bacillota bacterium]
MLSWSIHRRGKAARVLISTALVCSLFLAACGKRTADTVDTGAFTQKQGEAVSAAENVLQPQAVVMPKRDPFEPVVVSAPARSVTGRSQIKEAPRRDPFHPADGDASAFEEESSDSDLVPVQTGEEPFTGKVHVQILTLDLCWLDVFVDEVQVLRTNVLPDKTLEWTADSQVRLEQVGRERAVIVTVNGQRIGLLADLARRLVLEPYVIQTETTTIRITLEKRYTSGVLVGLRFAVVHP